jgi:hypothetical protein
LPFPVDDGVAGPSDYVGLSNTVQQLRFGDDFYLVRQAGSECAKRNGLIWRKLNQCGELLDIDLETPRNAPGHPACAGVALDRTVRRKRNPLGERPVRLDEDSNLGASFTSSGTFAT